MKDAIAAYPNNSALCVRYLVTVPCADILPGTTELNVTRTRQYLTTPFYDHANYPPKMDCYYVLVAEPGNRILIEILDVDMEAQIFRSCLDYIGFYEGKHERYSRPYLMFCGQVKDRQVRKSMEAFGECDAGWLSKEDGNCYRYVEAEPKVGWAEAQERCSQMQSNLASVKDERDFEFLDKAFGHSSAHAWIGYTDADEEGNLKGVDSKSSTIWPKPVLMGNADVRDCLYLDYSHSGDEFYQMADCRTKQTFICQKHNKQNKMAFFQAISDRGSSHRKAVQMSPVQDAIHANPVEMTLVPAKELPKLVDDAETKVMDAVHAPAKEQHSTTVVNVLPARPPRSLPPLSIPETTMQSMNTREESFLRSKRSSVLFDRPKMNVLENVSAISLDEFWSNKN
ncbi:unnamed protein product [Strongylus vulgaris]|uniref:C-type lectin domain-containing protein n=1 Tax=Strongylus vulgaris TaxID=40348 RepID=A0A3P7JGF8_STRVU|nr:unnamed protein product [Strongylus vulgaris]